MPYVIIKYGPYYAHGLIQHRIQKASGLFARLNQLDYEIEIIPINELNRLSIHIYDREVFRCDIRNLMFNVLHEDDAVCQRAVAAVEEAKNRMCNEYNTPRYVSIDKGDRELMTPGHHLADTLHSDVDLLYEHYSPRTSNR